MGNYIEELIKIIDFNQRRPIMEIVYEGLRKAIIYGIIPRGERIIEKEFATRLNISRTPLRSALKMLEMEELVEYSPKTGIVVKGISFEDIVEIYKIRQCVEAMVSLAVIENITQNEIKEIEEVLDLTEQKNKEGDIKEVIRLFGVFHSKIFEASRMKRPLEVISKINEYLELFLNITISKDGRREIALSEHREILRAIAQKNKEEIGLVIKKHLDNSLAIVIRELNKK